MKCMYCQGEMERGTAPFDIDRDGIHLHLDKAPAWLCRQCGEAYFDENDVNALQETIKVIEKQAKILAHIA
ncbi:MAG: hypothetical protein BWX80_00926 [Candidatus Hydrogenedentes bacterium ADurb.Bin101]|nr:MAG: hypothetical protein BWX80_00926 [Candidatus Hydrogenedentes bacterium ADurb.Bin101]HOH31686.1 YgiT-type zinc finger protein [Candidatus Hydrogenedentota bacterium]